MLPVATAQILVQKAVGKRKAVYEYVNPRDGNQQYPYVRPPGKVTFFKDFQNFIILTSVFGIYSRHDDVLSSRQKSNVTGFKWFPRL